MSTSQRDLEPGVQRDFSLSMSYGDYLALDQLLSAQHPRSQPAQHDELLFIIQHQTSELWLKLMVHELRSAKSLLVTDDLSPALKRLARVKRIQKVLTDQWSVLATLTPSEYAEIRPFLATSSGFQSWQYRAVEFLLGNKNADMVTVFDHDPAARGLLAGLLGEPSLYDEFLRYLARRGYAVPSELLERDWTTAHTLNEGLVRVFAEVYAAPAEHLGCLRDLRGARRPRGQLPALALPTPAGRRADHRAPAGHGRLERGRLPAPRARPHLLSRAVCRARADRRLTSPAASLASGSSAATATQLPDASNPDGSAPAICRRGLRRRRTRRGPDPSGVSGRGR